MDLVLGLTAIGIDPLCSQSVGSVVQYPLVFGKPRQCTHSIRFGLTIAASTGRSVAPVLRLYELSTIAGGLPAVAGRRVSKLSMHEFL